MARLHQSKDGKFTIRIPRGFKFSAHSLTTAGSERLKKAGVEINGLVPFFQLQLLDQHLEVFPLAGAFKRQLQFTEEGYLKVTRRAQSDSPKKFLQLQVISTDWEQLTFDWKVGGRAITHFPR